MATRHRDAGSTPGTGTRSALAGNGPPDGPADLSEWTDRATPTPFRRANDDATRPRLPRLRTDRPGPGPGRRTALAGAAGDAAVEGAVRQVPRPGGPQGPPEPGDAEGPGPG